MTDIRQALEEAFKVIHPTPAEHGDQFQAWERKAWRYVDLLDAEAWTSAAEMLEPEGWRLYLAAIDAKEWVANLTCDNSDDTFAKGHGPTPAHALLAACLKAKEQADG